MPYAWKKTCRLARIFGVCDGYLWLAFAHHVRPAPAIPDSMARPVDPCLVVSTTKSHDWAGGTIWFIITPWKGWNLALAIARTSPSNRPPRLQKTTKTNRP